MFHLVIRFSGMCLFTPVKLGDDQFVVDVALLKCDLVGNFPHDPQLGRISGDHFSGSIPSNLSGYDVTVCDGDEPIVTPSSWPLTFPNAVPMKLVADPMDIDQGILWDQKQQHKICGTRIRLYNGKIKECSNTGDLWQLVTECGDVVSGSQRIVTTEHAFIQEIRSSYATLRLEMLGSSAIDIKVRPLSGAKIVEMTLSSPDRDGVVELEPEKKNRSKDFGMVFSALKPTAEFTRCYLEQVDEQPQRRDGDRSTFHIPCVGACSAC